MADNNSKTFISGIVIFAVLVILGFVFFAGGEEQAPVINEEIAIEATDVNEVEPSADAAQELDAALEANEDAAVEVIEESAPVAQEEVAPESVAQEAVEAVEEAAQDAVEAVEEAVEEVKEAADDEALQDAQEETQE